METTTDLKPNCHFDIRVENNNFDIAKEDGKIRALNGNIGAIVAFTGLCRDERGTLQALEIEHYPGMAEAKIKAIAQDAANRWPLYALTIIHRHGMIAAGEEIVLVIAASAHRTAAFNGANFIMDYLKTDAPFWKKEIHKDGSHGQWVEAHDRDKMRRERW